MNIPLLAKQGQAFVRHNSPTILTAVSVAGLVTTAFLTGQATIKAAQLIHQQNLADGQNDILIPPPREFVQMTWKLYIPPLAVGAVSAGCMIAANRVGTRRAAAFATAYTLSEKAFGEYKDKVVEKLGENKETAIRDEIAQDRINKNPPSEVVIIGTNNVLCHDMLTDRYFQSDMETIRRAVNDINQQIHQSMYASLSDFYVRVGLPITTLSEQVGWTTDKLVEVSFSTALAPSGEPCLSIDFRTPPVHGYYRHG